MELYQVVLGIAAVFTVVVYLLDTQTEYLPEYVGVSGPIVLLHSKIGFGLVEWIAQYRRTWRNMGSMAIIICFIGMVLAGLGIGSSAIQVLLQPETTRITQPKNYLVIPGVNDFLPMSVAVEIILALLVGVVIHEGGHAIMCRVEDIDLESTGLVFLSFIPMGAFVEPDEESRESASRIGRMRMASAGILNNLFLTVGSVILVVLITSTLIVPVSGAAIGSVYSSSPAAESGLTNGDVVTNVNGEEISSNAELLKYLESSDAETLSVSTKSGESFEIERFVFISGVQNEFVPAGATIDAINGEVVSTTNSIVSLAKEQKMLTMRTDDTTYTIPAGAQIQLNTTSGNNIVYVTTVNGERVVNGKQFSEVASKSNQELEITYFTSAGDTATEKTTTIPVSSITQVYPGIAGIEFGDTGVVLYPVEQYLSVLQFDGSSLNDASILQLIAFWIVLPLGSLIPGLPFNFAGFTPEISSFYTTTIGGGMTPIVLFITTILFWMAWMNFNLAIFNCMPIWALDGHHVLRDGLHELEHRLNIDGITPVFKVVEYGIPLAALTLLLIVVAAPLIVKAL